MTSLASLMGMLLATAQGAVSARMASVLPRRVCFLYWVFVFDADSDSRVAGFEAAHVTVAAVVEGGVGVGSGAYRLLDPLV